MASRRWTPEDHAVFMAEYSKADLQELAERLGRTVLALHCRATQNGLERELTTRETIDEIREHLKENPLKPLDWISSAMGVPDLTISLAFKRFGRDIDYLRYEALRDHWVRKEGGK